MVDLNNYKAIIFDWDGTLVDTCGLILDAHNHVRKHYGHEEWTMEHFMGQASKSAREYYPEIYGDKADEAQVVLYDYVEAHHLNYLEPMEQAKDFLDMINLPIGIVSNKRHKTLHIEVEHVGWKDHFVSVIGAGFADKDKPSSVPLLHAMSQIDQSIKPQDVLYIGDTETDLLTAQNTGCDVIFIQSEAPRPDLIEKYQPLFACDSLAEFIQAVTSAMEPSNKCAV